MHNGVFKSLEEVVRFYNTRDVLPTCGSSASRADWGEICWPPPEVADNVNTSELGDLGLSVEEEATLVAFLRDALGRLPASPVTRQAAPPRERPGWFAADARLAASSEPPFALSALPAPCREAPAQGHEEQRELGAQAAR
jgi:hypothetical protein